MISIILTIVFGIISVISLIYAIRAKMYPCRLDFYVNDLVRIVSTKAGKYDSIKLYHNQKEVKNVFYLKCFFICSGEDVSLPDNLEHGIQINLPSGYNWLEVHGQERTRGLDDVKLDIDEMASNKLHISCPLIKRKELYSFEAYISGESDDYMSPTKITIYHRLKDFGKIQIKQVDTKNIESAKQNLTAKGIIYLFALLYMGLLLVHTLYTKPMRFVEKENPEKIYAAMLIKDDTIAVSSRHSALLPWDREEYAISNFKEKFEIESTLPAKEQEGEQLVAIMYLGIAISCLVLWCMSATDYNRRKKMCQALGDAEKSDEKIDG